MRSKSRTSNDSLSSAEKLKIEHFFKPYVKVRPYAHAFYKEKTGNFSVKYIPDSIHIAYIDPYFNNWTLAKYIDNKCFYPRLFAGVPMPKMIAYRLNGFWYDESNLIIQESTILDTLKQNHLKCFIKKATESYGGKGVYYFDSSQDDLSVFIDIIHSVQGDLVVQKGIEQCETLALIHDTSVNSIRHMSILYRDGKVKVLSSILRMGVGGAKVDNASSGGITVGIESNGRLKAVAYSSLGDKYLEHPTSHVNFDTIVIPNYQETIELVRRLHPQFPHFRLISWDITLNKDNKPVLIEANLCDGELDFHQLNNGPIFKEETEDILSEVFIKK